MFYKNVSYSDKTFYGITFKPGETKEVGNYINDRFMILADAPVKKDKGLPQDNQEQQKPSSEKSKKDTEKKSEPVSNKKEAKQQAEPEKSES